MFSTSMKVKIKDFYRPKSPFPCILVLYCLSPHLQLPALFPEFLKPFIFSPLLTYLKQHQYIAIASQKVYIHTKDL